MATDALVFTEIELAPRYKLLSQITNSQMERATIESNSPDCWVWAGVKPEVAEVWRENTIGWYLGANP